MTISCQAIPLFPFFVDLVGNYKEGVIEELKPIGIDGLLSYKCNCFYTIEAADSYLDDILPYENYPISKENLKKNGLNLKLYTSPMENGNTSLLWLVEMPGDGLYLIYNETPENP